MRPAIRRNTAIALLGFGSGAPLALVEDTLQAWLRSVGFDLATVGFISIVGLPTALQVLWAPLVDRFRPRLPLPRALGGGLLPRLGGRRAWLLTTQLMLIGAIALMGALGPKDAAAPLKAFAIVATAVAFLSATQDIANNAYRTDVLPPESRGPGASAYIAGYRIAMIATGAGVLALADHVSWPAAYLAGAGAMVVGLAGTFMAPEPPGTGEGPTTLAEAVAAPLRSFFGQPLGWFILLFVLVFKLPDYLAARMTVPFLLDSGFTKTDIAWIRQTLGLAVTIVGALAGGGLVAKLGLIRALLLFGVLQIASNAGFLWLATTEPTHGRLIAVIAVESFCTGLVAAGFVAFIMACCDPRLSATQYALLTSVMLLGSKLAGAVSGVLAESLGYAGFFAATMAVGLPGMALIPFVRSANGLHRSADA